MRNFVLLAALLAVSAFAGDRLLGVILVTDGGTASNATTGYGSAGCASSAGGGWGGACAQSFAIGPNLLIDVQCKDQGAKFAANRSTVDAGDGITLAADQLFTTSVGQAILVSLPDGGTYTGASVAISPLAGSARAECNINERKGNE